MKRLDIIPINYRWHWILEENKYSGKFENTDDPFFQIQEDVMLRLDRGFSFRLGFDIYKNAEIKPL